MKKIFLIIISLVALFLLFNLIGYNLFTSQNESIIKVKNLIPENIKVFVKKNFFYFSSIKALNKKQKITIRNLEKKLHKLENEVDFANEHFFPDTQFLKLRFKEIKINELDPEFFVLSYFADKTRPFYIELMNDIIILALKNGKIFYDKIDKVLNEESKFLLIKSNLKDNIEISDILKIDNFIYLNYSNKDDMGCVINDLNVVRAKININFLKFENFYSQKELPNKKGIHPKCLEYRVNAGTMALQEIDNNKKIIISTFDADMENKFVPEKFINDQTYKASIIASIDLTTKNLKIISSGHRNPLGLIVNSENVILSTEHGPRGGDEINKILIGKNYGYPFVSYGEPYTKSSLDPYYFKKNHKKLGFEEPIYSFVPSIGISRLIEVDNNFSEKWENNYLITSLKKGSIYRVEFDEDYSKVKFIERMYIGKRIRDIAYHTKKEIFFIAFESGDGSLGIISRN